MVIKVLNVDKLIKKLGDVGNIDYSKPITEATIKVQRRAKDLAPRDTGDLIRSIFRQVLKRRGKNGSPWAVGRVYTSLEYAIYQEFGTVFMEAQPFLVPAMNMERAGINASIKAYTKRELANISTR